jgi:hypothetical protein
LDKNSHVAGWLTFTRRPTSCGTSVTCRHAHVGRVCAASGRTASDLQVCTHHDTKHVQSLPTDALFGPLGAANRHLQVFDDIWLVGKPWRLPRRRAGRLTRPRGALSAAGYGIGIAAHLDGLCAQATVTLLDKVSVSAGYMATRTRFGCTPNTRIPVATWPRITHML